MPSSEKANSAAMPYPMTNMNFVVTAGEKGSASFSEISGIEASVDVVEFRQGNSTSLSTVKIPGLVHHGNVTLKYGYVLDAAFRKWVMACVSEQRGKMDAAFRQDVRIELINVAEKGVSAQITEAAAQAGETANVWVLKDAWVTKYTGPDFNAQGNGAIAMESVELAYEDLILAGEAQ